MNQRTKIWLMVATFLVIAGLILFGAVMSAYHWDFTRLSTVAYKNKTYTVGEDFRNIAIYTDIEDLVFAPSQDGRCKVVCYEEEKVSYAVTVRDGTLTIQRIDERSAYDLAKYIGINFGTPKITIYLPQNAYGLLSIAEDTGDVVIPKEFQFTDVEISLSTGDVAFFASVAERMTIKTSTGDICVKDTSLETLEISTSTGDVDIFYVTCQGDAAVHVSTGDVKLENLVCQNLTSTGKTGDIALETVTVEEMLSVERTTGEVEFDGCSAGGITVKTDTGDVEFDDCDAAELTVQTNTGDVTGSLLSEKMFVVQTDTGNVRVPTSTTGGLCRITTDTGDVFLTIQK